MLSGVLGRSMVDSTTAVRFHKSKLCSMGTRQSHDPAAVTQHGFVGFRMPGEFAHPVHVFN